MSDHASSQNWPIRPVLRATGANAPVGCRTGPGTSALQRMADESEAVHQLAQLQLAATARAPANLPIQRKPFIQNDAGERVDIGPKAMTLRDLITLSISLTEDAANEAAQAEIKRRVELLPGAGPFNQGVFSGDYKSDVDNNNADMHVSGQMGGSMKADDLKAIFEYLHGAMSEHHAVSGVIGTLEWHPTGAVVTKQIVELLGEALGSWTEWVKARMAKKVRKKADESGENPQRDKFADKLAPELVPEHMAYLRSLKGTAGLSIAAGGGMPKPEGIQDMAEDEQLAALNQSMVDKSEEGNARLAQYEEALLDDDMPGPSLRIEMDHTHLPKLLSKLS